MYSIIYMAEQKKKESTDSVWACLLLMITCLVMSRKNNSSIVLSIIVSHSDSIFGCYYDLKSKSMTFSRLRHCILDYNSQGNLLLFYYCFTIPSSVYIQYTLQSHTRK